MFLHYLIIMMMVNDDGLTTLKECVYRSIYIVLGGKSSSENMKSLLSIKPLRNNGMVN